MKDWVMNIKETDAEEDLINAILDEELEKKIISTVLKFKTTEDQINFLLREEKK